MDFETLKNSQSNFDKITKALETKLSPENSNNKDKYQDDRFWKPELDKTGNGYAVIRFLPASKAKKCHGKEFGLMRFKALAAGILRTH